MSAGASPFITEYRIPGAGIPSGIQVNGVLFVNGQMIVPYPSGFIMQASDGSYWQLGVNVVDGQGVLTVNPVTLS